MLPGKYFKDRFYYGYVEVVEGGDRTIMGIQHFVNCKKPLDAEPKMWIVGMHKWEPFNQELFDKKAEGGGMLISA